MSPSSRRFANRRLKSLAGCALLMSIACIATTAAAGEDDLVLVSQADPGLPPARWTGTIVNRTGRELRLRLPTGKERAFPAAHVARIKTTYCEPHRTADAHFARRDYRQALVSYRAALEGKLEPRDWVRRQIVSQMVWCLRYVGQLDQAGEYFLILLSSDAETQFFDSIPLSWIGSQPSAALEQKARGWLGRADTPAAVLMGASHLLVTAARPAAMKELDTLAGSADPRIAALAQAQLWRAKAFQAKPAELVLWRGAVAKMPAELRAGPYFVIGTALAREQPREAAAEWMRVPILFPRERQLAAASLLAAGSAAEKAGLTDDARLIYRELAERHTDAPEAAEATRRMQRAEP